MSSLETEIESGCRRQSVLGEVQPQEFDQEHKKPRFGFPRRVLLFVTDIIINLVTRIKKWYGSADPQGYLPNLHID